MAELHDILEDIAEDRASSTSVPVLNGRDGSTFLAEIEEAEAFLAISELGEDARESVIFHVLDNNAAASIKAQDHVSFMLFGQKVRYQIIKRRYKDSSPFTDFWGRRVTARDT